MPRTTKESLRRARMEAEQDKRDAQCRANGHVWRNEYNHMRYCETCYTIEPYQWIKPGYTVVHVSDPLWVGEVLFVTREGVRVHRKITDAWGTCTGTIECTFQPNELKIIPQEGTHATR